MSRNGGNLDNLHPRLSIAWLAPAERGSLTDALGRHGLVVGRDALDEGAEAAANRRGDAEVEALAAAEQELRVLDGRCSSAELAFADLIGEQRRLREAADWCELQPEHDARAAAQIDAHEASIIEHSRVAREATRKLERVLEQRAAAEAALEEARRELTGLGATGIDETDVRRQMEAASQDLRSASTEYQQSMTEVARRQSELDDLEKSLAEVAATPPARPGLSDGDQLMAMRQAVHAKFAPVATPSSGVTEKDVERAREHVRQAQQRADEAAHRLATARRRINGFETELTARINDGDARTSRHEAALALEAQVASVERQLTEAESAARAEVDDATRAMSRTELALERDRQERRDRRRQLGDLVALMPAAERPPAEDDVVAHAGAIGAAIRDLVAPMQPDVDHARRAAESLRAEHDAIAVDLERRRAELGIVTSQDRRTAIEVLTDREHGLIVLDDVVGMPGDGLLDTTDLAAVDTPDPILVLTSDSRVAAWGIELPADRGRIVHASELWAIVEVDLTAAESSTADQHPEPSSSR